MIVRSEEELANAIENGTESVEIEGDLAKGVIRIKYVEKAAWLVAISAIGAAVAFALAAPATAGTSLVASPLFAATGAVSTLGFSATATAISIAVAAGGVGVLNRLRDYDMEKISDTHVKLTKS